MKQRQWPVDAGRPGPVWVLFLLLAVLVPTAAASSLSEPAPGDPPGEPEQPASAAALPAASVCAGRSCLFLPFLNQPAKAPTWAEWDRTAALNLYQSLYLPGEKAAIAWNGSLANCGPGTTGAAFQKAVLQRINYFRQAAGVPPLTGLNTTYNRKAQAAALMMSRNQQLNHNPPSSWQCYSTDGSQAAGSSNLFLGAFGPAAVSGYMRDPGSDSFVGHRRWILFPQTREMGSGDIPPTSGYSPANALWVFDSHTGGPRPATRNPFVAWPPPGYVPYQVVYPHWSFSYPNADFSKATVSLTQAGRAVAITRLTPVNGYGENTLVWKINNMGDHDTWPRPASPAVYSVTIRGVRIDGQSKDFSYPVTIFSP